MTTPTDDATSWPGKRLGLPATGSRSVARVGRRLAGVAIDWTVAYAIGFALYAADPLAMIIIFVIEQYVFLLLFSGSIGHLAVGIRVVPLQPVWIGPIRPLIRSISLALLIPAFIWDNDQRGFHDKLAGTVLVRR
jgi:hypothetical protein